jgi:hypothetical protein
VFKALLCHAKFTPAALQRGDFGDRCRESAEAAGGRTEFGLSDFPRATRRRLSPATPAALLAPG